jgi:hypothetical protein
MSTTGKTHNNALTHRIPSILALGLILIATPCLSAQTTSTAPLPAQLAAAKTVFISNAIDAQGHYSQTRYDQIYAAVQTLNRFTIVNSPQQADLILQFSTIPDGAAWILHIIDTKTNVPLWSVSEGVPTAARASSQEKNLQTTINTLANDLQTICTPQPPTAP